MLLIGIYIFIGLGHIHIARISLASSIDRNEFSISKLQAEIRRKNLHFTTTHTTQRTHLARLRVRIYAVAAGIDDTKTIWPHQTTIFEMSQIFSMVFYTHLMYTLRHKMAERRTLAHEHSAGAAVATTTTGA